MKPKNNVTKMLIIFSLIMGAVTFIMLLIANLREKNDTYIYIDPETMKLVQLEEPKEGDPIAIVKTTCGEFRFVLYPEYSPEAVKNFTELAKSGYYDGTWVYNVQEGAYAGMGADNSDGSVSGGYGTQKERVERELSQDLWPFRGAVCMVNNQVERTFLQKIIGGGTYYCGSRFNVLNSIKFDDDISEEMRKSSPSEELAEAFISKGGIPNFSQQMTVIGQTYEGFDVVDKLASLDGTEKNGYRIPDEEVKIISVTISEYSTEDHEEISSSSTNSTR